MVTNRSLEDLVGEKPYEALVKGISDFAIIHLDRGANVLSWNKGAEMIFGLEEAGIVGQNFAIIFTAEDRAAGIPDKELQKAAATGSADDVRWHVRTDGSRVFANGVTTALRDASGALTGFAKICRDDTDRKLMEDALAVANERSSGILESLTDAFFALDKDWRFTYANKQCEPLLQRSAEKLIGKNIWEEFPEAVDSTFYKQYFRAVTEKVSVTFEEYYGPFASWFEVRAYPSADGGLSVYFHNIDDRAERRHLELLNSHVGNSLIQNTSLRELLDACVQHLVKDLDVAFARIWTLNEAENVLELQASAGMYTHLDGAHSRVPVGKFKIGMIAEERRPHLTNDVPNDPRISDQEWAHREGMKAFAGYPLIVDDGLVGVMSVFARRVLNEGTLSAMASVADGIANTIQRKRIENALSQSEEQYRLVAETASDAIITIDDKSTILFVNRAASRIFGHEQDQMVGKSLTMLMPEYLRNLHRTGQQRYLKTGKKHLQWDHVEVPGLHKEGHEFPIELSFGEYKESGKHVFIGIARDVSQRKRAEDALRESEQKFSTLADTVPQLVWMAEPDGSIFWYNRNWYDYTGTTSAEMEGWGWQAVHDPEMLPSVMGRWKASIESGESFEMEFPLRGADGEFRWFLTRVNAACDADGRIVRWFGTNTDIDVQRRLDLRNRFIIELDESVRGLESPKDITMTLARLLGEHLGADRCAYAEVAADEDHFYIPGDYTREGVLSIVGHYAMSQFGAEVLRLMRQNAPYAVDNVFTDERVTVGDLAAYEQTGIQAVICVPLHKNGRFAASMAVHQRVPRMWKSDEIELVTFVANRFW
ncbi:MAG: PAS domain S-box protein, partial [Acidobacteriota bacterium]